jgi:hypothetical protein
MRLASLARWALLRSFLALPFHSRFARLGFTLTNFPRHPELRITRLGVAAHSSARVPAGTHYWLELLESLGSRCRSVGPREVRLLVAGVR